MSVWSNDKSMAGQTERESFSMVPLKMYFIQKHEKWVRYSSVKPYQTLFQATGIQVHTVQNLQWCAIENNQDPFYVVNCHFSRHPDRH